MVHYRTALVCICVALAVLANTEARSVRVAREVALPSTTELISKVLAQIKALKAKVGSVSSLLSKVQGDAEDTTEKVELLLGKLQTITTLVNGLTGKTFTIVQGQLVIVQGKLDDVDSVINVVIVDLPKVVDGNLQLIENKLNNALNVLSVVKALLNAINGLGPDDLIDKVADLRGVVDDIVDQLEEKLRGASPDEEQLIQEILAKISSLTMQINEVSKTLEGPVSSLTASKLKAIESVVDSLTATLVKVQGFVSEGLLAKVLELVTGLLATVVGLLSSLLGGLTLGLNLNL